MIKVEYTARMGNVHQTGTRFVDADTYPRCKAYNPLAFELRNKYYKSKNKLELCIHKIWNMFERIYIEVCK